MTYKSSKWAQDIIARQTEDGLWVGYHNLSVPRKDTDTMEENLRRLEILGYTYDDEPIRKTIQYLADNLAGKKPMFNQHGQPMIQDFFVDLINATWIRRFTTDCEKANQIALQWSELYTCAFEDGAFNKKKYSDKYIQLFHVEPFRWAAQKQRNFYEVSILSDVLDDITEERFLDDLISSPTGIYYIYQKPLSVLPASFQSKETVFYLAAIKLLLRYKQSKSKLSFVKEWIMDHQCNENEWDFGNKAKDGIIFPLSDDWKCNENRINDCTWWIRQILLKF